MEIWKFHTNVNSYYYTVAATDRETERNRACLRGSIPENLYGKLEQWVEQNKSEDDIGDKDG